MDFNYEFTKLATSSAAHVARLTVLWPTIGNINPSAAGQLLALSSLLTVWRTRLSELWAAGWRPVSKLPPDDAKQLLTFQYIRNCVPHMGIVASDKTLGNTCKYRDICPWCYARRTTDLYRSLEIFKPKDLITMTATYHVTPEEDLRQVLLSCKAKSIHLCKTCAMDGSNTVAKLSVEPTGNGWDIFSGIMFCLQTTDQLITEPRKWEVIETHIANRTVMKAAASKFMRYPVSLLTGSADLVKRYLKARAGIRLYEVSGKLRGAKTEDTDSKQGLTDLLSLDLTGLSIPGE